MRIEYWQSVSTPPLDDWPPDVFNLYDCIDQWRDAEIVNIWAAAGLPEQLFIAFVVQLASDAGIESNRLRLLQFERTQTRGDRVLGMGMLNGENMAAYPDPTAISASLRDDYLGAWRALTSPNPTLISKFVKDRPGANVWLREMIPLLANQFPDISSGLPRWDYALLKMVRHRGPTIARVIGFTLTDTYDDGDTIGDWTLFHRLKRLASPDLPNPLVQIVENGRNRFRGNASLTSHGKAVLDGEISNAKLNPIDDWAAGVRLSSAEGNVWFNDHGSIVRG